MKIDFSQIIKNMNGEPLPKTLKGKEPTPLQHVCREALLGDYQDERINGEEKMKRYELAKKLDGVVDLKAEEIAKIKELVGKGYPAAVVGPVYEMLEVPAEPVKN